MALVHGALLQTALAFGSWGAYLLLNRPTRRASRARGRALPKMPRTAGPKAPEVASLLWLAVLHWLVCSPYR